MTFVLAKLFITRQIFSLYSNLVICVYAVGLSFSMCFCNQRHWLLGKLQKFWFHYLFLIVSPFLRLLQEDKKYMHISLGIYFTVGVDYSTTLSHAKSTY